MKTVLIAFAASLAASAAHGGAAQVTVPVHHSPYSGNLPMPTLVSAPLNPTQVAAGRWSLSLTDPNAILVPLSISTPGTGAWSGASMTFDVPYFAGESGRLILATPLIDDAANTPSIAEFLRDASAPSAIEDVFVLNSRARHIWDSRRQTIGSIAMGQVDAKVVFWLLQTEVTLVQKTYLQIDEPTRAAADWMRGAVADPSKAHLFAAGGVNRAVASTLLAQLDARDSQLYSLIVNRIGIDVGNSDEAIRKDACTRAKALAAFYREMHNGSPGYDGWQQHELIVTSRLASCTSRSVAQKVRSGQVVADDELQDAQDVAGRLAKLADQTPRTPHTAPLIQQARGRAAELRMLGASAKASAASQ